MQRLNMSTCPACRHANADEARFCIGCGGPLVQRCPACNTINARTRMRCHHCAAMLQPEPSAVDLPMSAASAAQLPTLTDAEIDTEPGSALTLSLRENTLPPTPLPPRAGFKVLEIPLPVISDDLPELTTAPEAASTSRTNGDSTPASAPSGFKQGLAERKAEMRAAVRRARTRNQLRSMAEVGERPEVLLLEPDADTRARLSSVLSHFGFNARAVSSVSEADALIGSTRFVASFIGLGPQDAQAVGLCTRLRATPTASDRPLAVVAMVEKGQHAQRVRMELAGAHAVLFRPVDRGHVARALEDSGVRLPHDPRATAGKKKR